LAACKYRTVGLAVSDFAQVFAWGLVMADSFDRRDVLKRVAAVAAVTAANAGCPVEAKVVDAEPRPLFFVLECQNRLSPANRQALRECWEACFKGPERFPVIILDGGLTLKAAYGNPPAGQDFEIRPAKGLFAWLARIFRSA